jgi:hypothetical protein
VTIFIERRLELTDGREVIIRFLQPVQDVRQDSYRCEYIIDWPDRRRSFYGFGVDAVQALVVAMCNSHAELLSSPEGKAGTLQWLGNRDLGLPLAGTFKPEDFA